jgi:hypothetical protein
VRWLDTAFFPFDPFVLPVIKIQRKKAVSSHRTPKDRRDKPRRSPFGCDTIAE